MSRQPRKGKKGRKARSQVKPFTPASKKFIRFALGVVLILTTASYSNIFNNELTNWDDDRYVNKNPYIREFSTDNLQAVFWGEASDYMGNYHPLTMLSLAIDFHLSDTQKVDEPIQYKVNPTIFHLTNLLLHSIATILIFFIILQLLNFLQIKRSGEIALIVALLFGVHTMHVESVTWISERKDVLYAAFFFGSMLAYQYYAAKRNIRYLGISLFLFLLSLLSKGQAVSLALILPAIDWIYGRKILSKRVLAEKLPYFILALIFGIIAIQAQEATEAIHKDEEFSLFERLVYASYGFTTYILKLAWPFRLSAIYPYPYSSGNIPAVYHLALLVPVFVAFLFFYSIKKRPLTAFAIYFFTANIIFLLQILPVGNSVMADRYVYIPSAGFFLIIGLLYKYLAERNKALIRPLQLLLIIYVAALGIKTFQRNNIWENSLALWNDVISKNKTATVAYNNRGSVHRKQDNFKKAVQDFSSAIRLDSTYAHAYYNRGTTLKDWAEEINNNQLYHKAIPDFNKAIKLKPEFPEAYHNRGLCYDNTGQFKKAISDFSKAIRQDIDDYKIYVNRGVVKGKMGELDAAVQDFERALSMAPEQPDALSNMGLAYSHKGNHQKALKYFNQSIKVNPEFENAYYNRGLLHYKMQNHKKALADFTKTIRLNPSNPSAYYQRALVYRSQGNTNKACKDLQKSTRMGYKPAKRLFAKTCGN